MPWYICAADASGNRIVGAEETLSPGPADVEYPLEPAGVISETPDGRVVQQQPTSDPRRRVWIWRNMPTYITRFRRLVMRLEGLRSRTRREQGLSPYIYLKEDQTAGLRLWDYQSGTASAVTTSTLTDGVKAWTVNRYADATVEILSGTGAGQRRTIVSNTANQLTVTPNWTTVPTGATYRLQASVSDWVRCRVLQVSKKVSPKSGVMFEEVRVAFVINDPAYQDLG